MNPVYVPCRVPKHANELRDLCREMLAIFDTVEDSEVSGKEFHPTTVQSCRVMDAQRIAEIFDRMRQIT